MPIGAPIGIRIGYRAHQLGGKWCWSRYKGDGSYHSETIKGAVADDFLRADGLRVLNFGQAVAEIRELASAAPVGPLTVAEAMKSYFKRLRQKGRRVESDERRSAMHILPGLGAAPVDVTKTRSTTPGSRRRYAATPPRLSAQAGHRRTGF